MNWSRYGAIQVVRDNGGAATSASRRWVWLGTGQWELLLGLGLLSLIFQLFFWV